MVECPIKGVDPEDCVDCDEVNYYSCIYVKTWKYIKSGELAKNPSTPFKEFQSSNTKAREGL